MRGELAQGSDLTDGSSLKLLERGRLESVEMDQCAYEAANRLGGGGHLWAAGRVVKRQLMGCKATKVTVRLFSMTS